MKKTVLSGMIPLVFVATVLGADVQQALRNAAGQARGSLCVVECTLNIADKETTRKGVGVCIDAATGMVMTLAIPTQTPLSDVKDIILSPVGKDDVHLRARLQGMDTLTGLTFLRCEGKHPFTAVKFLPSAELSLGDLVVSAGVGVGSPNQPLALGAGYISSDQHLPNRVLRVTGGTLTMIGSVVFNDEGQAVGLVATQPYLPFQMYRGKKSAAQALLLRNLEQAVSFTPVEEFVQVLMNIPREGTVRRPNWIGGLLVAVPVSYREAKGLTGPAVMLDQVLPGSPAAKAGLKNRDIIVGVNGAPIPSLGDETISASALRQSLARMKPGQTVTVTVRDDSGPREVKLQVVPMPVTPAEAPKYYQTKLGFVLREKVPFDRAGSDSSAKAPGMIVYSVKRQSAAAKAKLRRGDLVMSIDNRTVTTVAAAEKAVQDCLDQEIPRDVTVVVLRGVTPERLTIKAPEE